MVAVSLLGEAMPDYFGTFDVAAFTLFSVTGGEPWPETLPRLNEDGTANWAVMLFCAIYFVITTWLILQVGDAPRIALRLLLPLLSQDSRSNKISSRWFISLTWTSSDWCSQG